MKIGKSSVLIDTNVWSEISRPRPDEAVAQWMRENFEHCVLSALVLAEMRYGVALVEGERGQMLATTLDDLLVRIKLPIADFDRNAADVWGPLRARLRRSGELIGERDMLIAAQAIALGIPLVSRNVAELSRTGARIINPWQP